MKNVIQLLLSFLLVIGTMGCSDFLEEELDSVTTSNNLSTITDVNAALTGVYSGLFGRRTGGYYGRLYYYMQDIPSDHTRAAGFPGPLDSFEGDANNNIINGTYSDIYSLIFRANNLLANLNPAIDPEYIAQVEGELRFLRALAYYDLTSLYGDVVLVVAPELKEGEAPELTPIGEIESFIIREAEMAEALLGADAPESRPGAVTKGAAMMLRLKTHLRRKEWQSVIDMAVRLNELDRYQLVADYMQLWELGQPFNEEVIFNVMATATPFGRGNLGELASGSTDLAVYMYDFQTDWRGFGAAFHLERSHFFSYDSADIRWSQGCRQFWLSSQPATLGDTVKSPGPDGERVIKAVDGTDTVRYLGPGTGNSRLYFSNKYPHPDADNEGVFLNTDIFHNNNLPVYRWADVLLAWSEAINELNGPTPEAIGLLDEVRLRAGLGSIIDDLETLDQASFKDAILRERGWEFALEGKRREDLFRHGKFVELVSESFGYTSKSDGVPLTLDQYYFPIPFTELELNPQWGD